MGVQKVGEYQLNGPFFASQYLELLNIHCRNKLRNHAMKEDTKQETLFS